MYMYWIKEERDRLSAVIRPFSLTTILLNYNSWQAFPLRGFDATQESSVLTSLPVFTLRLLSSNLYLFYKQPPFTSLKSLCLSFLA